MSKEKYYFSKSLEKGLRILALFDGETPVMTQSQIAKKLDLNATSTYRYINTLVEMGFLDKSSRTKEIRPSIRSLFLFTNLMRATDHLRVIKDLVDRISIENQMSVDVTLAMENSLARIYHREADDTLTYSLPDYTKNCLHNTALGKAYLSSLPHNLLIKKINTLEMVAKTDNTILDKDRLIEEVLQAKERKYAMANQEYVTGIVAIAAPLFDPITQNGVGAVSFDFSILQTTPDEIEKKYQDMIIETAQVLSEILPPANKRK